MSEAKPDRTARRRAANGAGTNAPAKGMQPAAVAGRVPPHMPTSLRDMVVFRIYRAWSAANPIFTRLCEGRFNITRREWRILATSVVHGRLSSAALADAAMLDSVRTSRTITALCEKGWLQRQRDTRDARNIYVEASPAGLELYRRIMPIVVELNEQVAQDLDAEELRVLSTALDKIMRRSQSLLQAEVIKDRLHRSQGGTRRQQGC